MIEIKNFDGYPNCFELSFSLKDYIPEKYFKISSNELGAKLYFYIDLFKQNDLFEPIEKNRKIMIWSLHYQCHLGDIPFTMIYDEDYDFITFASEPEHKTQIAEHIKLLVEKQKLALD